MNVSSTHRLTSVALRLVAGAAVVGASVLGIAGTASAHVSPDKAEVPAGAYTNVQLLVPHGCDGSATTKVEVQVPEQLISASPYWISGWEAEATTEELDEPITDAHGEEVTERTATLSWTASEGNALPDGQYLDFGVGFKAPEEAGDTLFFKTIQTCEEGTAEWITEWDGEGDEPEKPAPAVKVVEGSGDGHGDATDEAPADEEPAEDETAAASEADATASGSSDDGSGSSNALAIAGLVAGVGGLALAGAAFAKATKTA